MCVFQSDGLPQLPADRRIISFDEPPSMPLSISGGISNFASSIRATRAFRFCSLSGWDVYSTLVPENSHHQDRTSSNGHFRNRLRGVRCLRKSTCPGGLDVVNRDRALPWVAR